MYDFIVTTRGCALVKNYFVSANSFNEAVKQVSEVFQVSPIICVRMI